LSAEEVARAKAHRERAARKLKMARVLGDGGFDEEARPVLLEATFGFACALAAEHRITEPAELKEALQPPLANWWANALPVIHQFVQAATSDGKPLLRCLEAIS
jgi:hypothetical protein